LCWVIAGADPTYARVFVPMHINRLRLLGFKSFVEPIELMVEKG
jgi:hypothetical protein